MIALLAGLFAGAASAQVASASLLGTVVDESSAVAPGVTVSAREESTGFTRATVTDSEGGYAIEALLPGSYTVTATARTPGFRPTVAEHVQLTVSQKALLDLKLFLGEANKKDFVHAEETLRAAISYAPNWFKAHWMLAQVLEAVSRQKEAEAEAAMAVALDGGKHLKVTGTLDHIRAAWDPRPWNRRTSKISRFRLMPV